MLQWARPRREVTETEVRLPPQGWVPTASSSHHHFYYICMCIMIKPLKCILYIRVYHDKVTEIHITYYYIYHKVIEMDITYYMYHDKVTEIHITYYMYYDCVTGVRSPQPRLTPRVIRVRRNSSTVCYYTSCGCCTRVESTLCCCHGGCAKQHPCCY